MARVVRTPDVVKRNWRFSANDLSGWTDTAKYDVIDEKGRRKAQVDRLLALRHPPETEALDFGNSILSNGDADGTS